jgi:hypothetical protein
MIVGDRTRVMGVGLGQTGPFSLKMAPDSLGFGPTDHMEEVFADLGVNLRLWRDAVAGNAD